METKGQRASAACAKETSSINTFLLIDAVKWLEIFDKSSSSPVYQTEVVEWLADRRNTRQT